MSIGMAIGRFPYTTSRKLQRPILFRPLMLEVPEPTDDEIAARLGISSPAVSNRFHRAVQRGAGPVGGVELGVDVLDVVACCLGGDVQLAGHLTG